MNDRKQAILEYVKEHAMIRLWGHKESEEKSIAISLHYPNPEKGEYFYEVFNLGFIKKEEVKILPAWFKDMAEKIIKKMEERSKPKEPNKWECKKIIYQVCPERLCGNNPCSCEEVNNA